MLAVKRNQPMVNAGIEAFLLDQMEDVSRVRDEALWENFAWLNRFSLSLLKQKIPTAPASS